MNLFSIVFDIISFCLISIGLYIVFKRLGKVSYKVFFISGGIFSLIFSLPIFLFNEYYTSYSFFPTLNALLPIRFGGIAGFLFTFILNALIFVGAIKAGEMLLAKAPYISEGAFSGEALKSSPEKRADKNICKKCGKEVPNGVKFCVHCGHKVV